jgi:hypothetical protein
LYHALVEERKTVVAVHAVAIHVNLVNAQYHCLGSTHFAAVELDSRQLRQLQFRTRSGC